MKLTSLLALIATSQAINIKRGPTWWDPATLPECPPRYADDGTTIMHDNHQTKAVKYPYVGATCADKKDIDAAKAKDKAKK